MIITTVTVDGEEIPRDSALAYEVYGREVGVLVERLIEIGTVRPMRLRDDDQVALRKLSELGTRARRVAERARSLEGLGHSPEDALQGALQEADWVESR